MVDREGQKMAELGADVEVAVDFLAKCDLPASGAPDPEIIGGRRRLRLRRRTIVPTLCHFSLDLHKFSRTRAPVAVYKAPLSRLSFVETDALLPGPERPGLFYVLHTRREDRLSRRPAPALVAAPTHRGLHRHRQFAPARDQP